MAGFTSPLPLRASPELEVSSLHESLRWAPLALRNSVGKEAATNTFTKIVKYANELTPRSGKLTGNAMKAILIPMPMPSLMDEEDANDVLDFVVKKVVARAKKRKAAADAAAAAEEARRVEKGAARAAKRARIAARPAPTKRWVDNAGRVHKN